MKQPVQWRAQILALREGSGHRSLTLSGPPAGFSARPGQFVALAEPGQHPSALLRRTGWVVTQDDGLRASASLDTVTSGRDWLSGLGRKDTVDVIGPIGRPFSLPKQPTTCLLVGSGPAMAALIGLGRALVARDCRVEFIFLQSSDAGYGLLDARRIASATHVIDDSPATTDSEVHAALSQRLDTSTPGVVYSAGSSASLRLIAEVVTSSGVPHQCLVDFAVGCGTGICAGCALPVRGNDGVARVVRGCTEGAVFNADLLQWPDAAAGLAIGSELA
ncbi:MAG: hypothetical protein K0U64_07060 [Actinomycetia bacterium]|nr:hypothetical protein [Actinomycetes bacterium]